MNPYADDPDVIDIDDLYDHERLAIQRVYAALTQSIGSRRDPESFRTEVIERFAEIGFQARVVYYEVEQEGGGAVIQPEISLVGRLERQEEGFDHDLQAHEVQTDILGTGRRNDSRSTSVAVSGFKRSSSGLYVPGR